MNWKFDILTKNRQFSYVNLKIHLLNYFFMTNQLHIDQWF